MTIVIVSHLSILEKNRILFDDTDPSLSNDACQKFLKNVCNNQ
jgi:hypothetical protein